jgi:hypothetical protein
MKKFLFLAFILLTVSCRKDLSGTDYDQLIGKWKLVYSLQFTTTTIERLNPSDNYEIDFNRNGKVYKKKNEHTESKDKVEDCVITYDSPPSQYKRAYLHVKNRTMVIEMEFPHYSSGYDTLIMDGYYPYENDPNHNPYHYGHYYVRE